jgi:GNAT superfamily N-acetyltransferase
MTQAVRVEAVASKRDFDTFIKLPWKIYRKDPHWVPPLIMDQKNLLNRKKNPFFAHSEIRHFLARRDGQAVGRISAVIDRNYNEFQGEKTGFFGFFETVNSPEAAAALVEAAGNWLRERGMERLLGPANPSTNDTLGLLVAPFGQPPVLHMPYNPDYYPGLLEKAGCAKAKDLYAYYMEDITPLADKVKRVAEIIRRRNNITVRSVNMKRLLEEIDLIKVIYNDAWTPNWGFVPWTDEELEHLAQELKRAVIPELVLFAFVDGEPAGFSLSLPDLNQALIHANGRLFPFGLVKVLWHSRHIDLLRVLAMGVRRKFQKLGIDAVFYYETYTRGTARGFHRGEFSWILEDNLGIRNTMENLGARIYKTYRMYERAL